MKIVTAYSKHPSSFSNYPLDRPSPLGGNDNDRFILHNRVRAKWPKAAGRTLLKIWSCCFTWDFLRRFLLLPQAVETHKSTCLLRCSYNTTAHDTAALPLQHKPVCGSRAVRTNYINSLGRRGVAEACWHDAHAHLSFPITHSYRRRFCLAGADVNEAGGHKMVTEAIVE